MKTDYLAKLKKPDAFMKLRAVKRLTEWEDLKLGCVYHYPPLIYNGRCDFVIVEKTENTARIRKIGQDFCQTIFRSDITSNFIVKKWCCNEP